MKQLILYFLFFVAAALTLVECANFFPSKTKVSGLRAPSAKNQKKTVEKLAYSAAWGSAHMSVSPSQQKKPVFRIPFNEPSFTLNMVNYINHYQFMGNQYFGLYNNFINAKHLFDNPHGNSFASLFSNGDSNEPTASVYFDPKK